MPRDEPAGSLPEGATPLDPDEDEGLIPPHITTRAELNAWEQANILRAQEWLSKRRSTRPVIDMGFLRELHRRMFSDTWESAGKFQKTMKNIGVAPELVPERTQNLFDDVQYWLDHETYSVDEIAARFHHLLVAIHPFPNGNGRHARLMADAGDYAPLLSLKYKVVSLRASTSDLGRMRVMRMI